MGKLFLIRHAKTNVDPSVDSTLWRLEPSAQDACRDVAERLKCEDLSRIVTSDLARAKETGQHIADYLDLPCQSAPNLHEHERTGEPFVGAQTWLETVTAFFARHDELVFGAETATQARERFDKAVREVLQSYPNETLAICSHGTVISLLVAHYNSVDALEVWQKLKMPDVLELSSQTFELMT